MLLTYLQRKFVELFDDETGADLVEYALILALVAVVAIVVLTQLGERIVQIFRPVRLRQVAFLEAINVLAESSQRLTGFPLRRDDLDLVQRCVNSLQVYRRF